MALRNTQADVKAYMGTPNEPLDLTIHLTQASELVDELLADQGLTSNRLKRIELNLAAHYAVLAIEKGGLKMQKVGESMESYQDQDGSTLGSTRFGQQAMALDPTGNLSSLASPKGKAEFRVV